MCEKEEQFKEVLKMICCCIRHADYYSAKELAEYKLEQMEEEEKKIKKHI